MSRPAPALATRHAPATTRATAPPDRRPPLLLRVTCLALFVFPSSMVIAPVGAAGTVPMILSGIVLVAWLASWIWGLHHPVPLRHPARLAAGILVVGVIASYAALQGGWTGDATVTGLAAADRWLLLALASLGLVLATSDAIRSTEDALSIARWLLAGGTFSCVVGVIQFVFHINPMEWVQLAMPGFTDNGGDTAFQARGNLLRVAGSTFHSIEFGVTSSMLLPLAIWRALFDRRGSRVLHGLQIALLLFAIATTVSRSGTLGAVVAVAVLIPFLPRMARRWAIALAPLPLAALFLVVPGFVGTITGALTADTSDPSIATRVNNYPRVAQMIDAHPWFGQGPGTYIPANALQILDNEYLNAVVSMGLVGLAAVAFYLVVPGLAALVAARHAVAPELRALCAAVAGGLLCAAVCSGTFDSLSFPTFALLFPLIAGISGGAWRLVATESGIVNSPDSPLPPRMA